ncbi:AMP-dependent synthetase [Hydrogenophaga crassostreae]|uniref:AMP-dependent synthetase n=1 Tax=Hydrogenophaga crassostreae TaxID=1763535 RepID=A0A162VVF6_9BURK|nr:AMP-binding protein [Hydrogenophaga crassostreae]AOW12697.1 AMP-dependent synthetase [Hydrogenophaga crassostreae]OAD40569.1 AMP-dependent synthetase [Hydrogenophaga crassostreae]
MNLAHLLLKQARRDPSRPAIFSGADCVATHGEWAERAARVGARLQAQGLVPGDRVVLFMHNHPRYLELLFGAWWAGLVVVPVNAKLHVKELQWIVDNAQVRWAFVSNGTVPNPAEVTGLDGVMDVDSGECGAWLNEGAGLSDIEARSPDDTAWLFYTSGTTGRPKGVMITHRNLMTMGLTYFNDVDPIAAEDAIAYAAPMSHGAGLYAIPHLMAGARHVVPASGGFDAAELFALGREIGPLSLFAAPTIVKRIVEQAELEQRSPAECGHSFKTIVYGGAPMYAADIQRALRVMGPRFVQIYGQGESPMTGTALSRAQIANATHPSHAEHLASVGVAQTPVGIRVAGPDGQALPPGEVGEVLIQGDSVMAGYWRNPEATASAIRNGWLWTGDMGALDAEGFLTLKDRSKDLIISGGSNIYPREVEEVLLTAPGVAEVAVVGTPDAEWGESVVAFVVPQAGLSVALDAQALDAFCLEHIARFKRPKRYEIVDSLPKNNYGKVLKTALREQVDLGEKGKT